MSLRIRNFRKQNRNLLWTLELSLSFRNVSDFPIAVQNNYGPSPKNDDAVTERRHLACAYATAGGTVKLRLAV